MSSSTYNYELLNAVMDANPSSMFVVDAEVQIVLYNLAAAKFMQGEEGIIGRRGGEVLHCIQVQGQDKQCGKAAACADCVIRNSAMEAIRGERVVRRRHCLELQRPNGDVVVLYVQITASPFRLGEEQYALLVVEDITELTELRHLIPICAKCKKIRDDNQYWEELESFFKRHWAFDFSHGLCPSCLAEFYRENDISMSP